jgi:hypothetical protein
LRYNEFLKGKQKSIQDKKKEIALKFIEEDTKEHEIEAIVSEIFLESSIHSRDAHLLFMKLYTLVEAYKQIKDAILLPDEIENLCVEFAYTYPKPMYMVDNSGVATEREKGLFEREFKNYKESGELKINLDRLKSILKLEN